LVGEVSYDAKHRPVSTNVTRSMKHLKTVDTGSDVRLHGLMPVKKPYDAKSGGGSTVFVATLHGESKLSLHSPDGEARLSDHDLGHHVTHMSLSAVPEHSYVLTGDASGGLHVLMVEFVMRNATAADAKPVATEGANETKHPKKVAVVVVNTTAKFSLPNAGDGRKITSVLSVDRGSSPLFVAGDSSGSIAVFLKNGTLKGRIKVTEEPGGVKGLLRGQGQTVLYFTAHSFGFLSVAQVEVMSPPCTGWNSPIFDVAPDPLSTYARVVLALEDGNVVVFSTSSGKNKDKSCDLTMKFPHMSVLPFRLHAIRGHIMGLPTPLESTKKPNEHNRELYFFNLNAMEGGYGNSQSRAVTLQASFEPRRLQSFALHLGSTSTTGSSPPAASKVYLSLQFAEQKSGLEIYELNLKTPSGASLTGGGGLGGGDSGGGDGGGIASWLDWLPKVGIFGITLIGVVIWNVRKVAGKNNAGGGGGGGGMPDGMDEDFFREQLKKKAGGDGTDDKLEKLLAKAKQKAAAKKAGASGGASGSSGLGADIGGLGDLAASTKEMEDLLASMGGDDY